MVKNYFTPKVHFLEIYNALNFDFPPSVILPSFTNQTPSPILKSENIVNRITLHYSKPPLSKTFHLTLKIYTEDVSTLPNKLSIGAKLLKNKETAVRNNRQKL